MDITRVELRDGQWAEAHSRPSHAQMKAFYRAFRDKPEAEMLDVQDDLITILCVKWDVKDEDGVSLPLDKKGIDRAPQDVITELTDKLSAFLDTERVEEGKGGPRASNGPISPGQD